MTLTLNPIDTTAQQKWHVRLWTSPVMDPSRITPSYGRSIGATGEVPMIRNEAVSSSSN